MAERRKKRISVVLSDEEKKEIEARAKNAGMSMSSYLKKRGLGMSAKKKKARIRSAEPILRASGEAISSVRDTGRLIMKLAQAGAVNEDDARRLEASGRELCRKADELHTAVVGEVFEKETEWR